MDRTACTELQCLYRGALYTHTHTHTHTHIYIYIYLFTYRFLSHFFENRTGEYTDLQMFSFFKLNIYNLALGGLHLNKAHTWDRTFERRKFWRKKSKMLYVVEAEKESVTSGLPEHIQFCVITLVSVGNNWTNLQPCTIFIFGQP